MKTIKNILFAMAAVILSVSLWSCDDQSSQAFFADDELPKIFMEWSNVQVVEEGDTIAFTPIVSPSDNANFSWTINGVEIANTKELRHVVTETEDFVLRFEVERNGIRTHRTADFMIRRIFVPKPYNKKSVAFVNAATVLMTDIQWESITHLVWASSAIVAADGSIDFIGFDRADIDIENLIAVAHNHGVFVLLDVAGAHNYLTAGHFWGSWPFYDAILDAARRTAIINNILAVVEEYGFDGINIYFDRESVNGAFPEAAAITAFISEFADALPTENLTHEGQPFFMTMSAFIGWTNWGLLPAVGNPRIDWYHVYAFGAEDLPPNHGSHSSMWQFTSNTEFWINHAGIPAERMVPVAPAFGLQYDFRGTPHDQVNWGNLWQFTEYISFRNILAAHPNAYQSNSLPIADGLFFDGFPAIDEKAAAVIANGWGGMGLWKADFDVTDHRSLLRRMNQELGN